MTTELEARARLQAILDVINKLLPEVDKAGTMATEDWESPYFEGIHRGMDESITLVGKLYNNECYKFYSRYKTPWWK